ncbi:unnamed protein product [Lupinus luteus]|uniref:Uncharacterized protein n=1 Tax=Lupinus luteus TaxID=3873 RepID=A0AAV1WKU8_LUPLU
MGNGNKGRIDLSLELQRGKGNECLQGEHKHNVLYDSRKYPLKEHFVKLLKGSLRSFLHLFTYPNINVKLLFTTLFLFGVMVSPNSRSPSGLGRTLFVKSRLLNKLHLEAS